jgi:ParB/RepB/Spo0J family partition protein
MTQSATIDPSADLATPEVDIDRVHIVEGYNPRKLMDKEKLAQMAESMKEVGMLKPLLVVAVDDHFELVAGERRHKAAVDAGLKKVPIIVRDDGNRELMTAVENTQQEALDPVAKARSWKMVAKARGLTTNAQIAEAVYENVDTVGAHMRLLRLPEGVQRYFAEGVVNIDAERPLRDIARTSPRVAECVCEVARREKVKPGRFVERLEDLLRLVPEAKFDDPPTMIPVFGASLEEVVVDTERREVLLARLCDLWSGQTVDAGEIRVNFAPEEIEQARAYRVLVEHKSKTYVYNPARFICDAEFAAGLAEVWVDRLVKLAEEDRKARQESAKSAKARREGVDPSASEDEQAEQRKKAAAKRKREETKARKERARSIAFNEEIGRKISRRHGKRAAQRAAVRFDLLAGLLFEAYPDFGSVLRLVLAQLQKPEGDKVVYATASEASDYLRDRVARADSVEEKIELLVEAVVVDQLADTSIVSASESRRGRSLDLDEEAEKALGPDIKALTPTTEGTSR